MILGLNTIDLIIILLFIAVMLWIGRQAQKKNKNTDDFFLAGRKLGKVYQFFLNFGCSTNADQAVAVSREVYRQGIGGMWIQFLVLFLTPFYWFSTFFFRRVRLTTIGDYFTERFNSKFLGASYAVFTLLMALLGGGVGYMVAAKTMVAMTPKPIEACTPEQKQSVAEFTEFQALRQQLTQGLTEEEQVRFDQLNDKNKKGELKSFHSYTHEIWFYFIYALVVGVYTMMGGFRAAAITDAIQGILILTFSMILIPAALIKVGGFGGLHATVPDYMFQLFGSTTMSEYAWYTIVAMALANLVSIVAVVTGMQTAGSATNETTARIGMIGGMFTKRVIMIFWALAGLLAIAIYGGKLSDPDLIWGFMTNDLLVPGAIGLMLAGILAANMSTLSATSISYAALFIRNLYKPLVPNRSEDHYLTVGRIVIGITLLGGIGIALVVDNLLELFQYIISIPAIFGASIWLGFIWRRVTKWAVIVQFSICLVIYAVIPNVFPEIDSIKHNPAMVAETLPRETTIRTKALQTDVDAGLATVVGEKIEKDVTVAPVGIFFDKVSRDNPDDPNSPKVGIDRFHAEIWVISWFGFDLTHLSKAQLVALRFLFDAFFPFLLLFLISFFTKPVPKHLLDKFFVKLHTPVQATPEEDLTALARGESDPGQFEKEKMFPHSQWEFRKWKKSDYLGFFGSWVLVGLVILLLWVVVTVGGR
ncbi:MAG: sodium:solute symporter family protein [Bacteroidales bacterium]|nr:sodium:solute symporter family protein [Bacteroidales bacterium]MDD4811987.1 sodium:solute symporter family protein [Bacteroidales bacterium]